MGILGPDHCFHWHRSKEKKWVGGCSSIRKETSVILCHWSHLPPSASSPVFPPPQPVILPWLFVLQCLAALCTWSCHKNRHWSLHFCSCFEQNGSQNSILILALLLLCPLCCYIWALLKKILCTQSFFNIFNLIMYTSTYSLTPSSYFFSFWTLCCSQGYLIFFPFYLLKTAPQQPFHAQKFATSVGIPQIWVHIISSDSCTKMSCFRIQSLLVVGQIYCM